MNNKKLIETISESITDLKAKKISVAEAVAMSRLSSSIISAAKGQIDYQKMIGDNHKKIDFFED